MKKVLPFVISREQGAFIGGRSISDNILVATEMHHSIINASAHAPSLMLKLDMAKAFDRVSWDYIEQVLVHLGFPSTWIHWVMGAIRKPLNINGFLSVPISCSMGIRQGCPLSPYLFTICAEVLSRLFLRAQHGLIYEGVRPT